jgi:hypothetical protein
VTFNVTRDPNDKDTIVLQLEGGNINARIKYFSEESALWFDDNEQGFRFVDENGTPLKTETEQKAAATTFSDAYKANPNGVLAELINTVEHRMLATDGNADRNDFIQYDELENVHNAITGKTVLNAATLMAFDIALDRLTDNPSGKSLLPSTREEFRAAYGATDSNEIMKTLRANSFDETFIKAATPQFIPTPEDAAREAEAARLAQAEAEAKAKAEADARQRLADDEARRAEENKGKPTKHRTITRVEEAFGIKDVDGVLDTGLKIKLQEYLQDTLETVLSDEEGRLLDKGNDGKKNLINLTNANTEQNELYKLTKTHQEGRTVYHVHAIDENGKQVEGTTLEIDLLNEDPEELKALLENPVLKALFGRISNDQREKIRATQTHFEEEEAERTTKIKDQQRAEAQAFLTLIGREDLKEGDFLEDILDKSLDPNKLREKYKITEKNDTEFSTFIASMIAMNAERASFSNDIYALNTDLERQDSLFKMFNYMQTGKEYDPIREQELIDGVPFRDNILGMEAYDILQTLPYGGKIHIRHLIDDANPEQEAKILRAFDGELEVTREQVLAYVRKEHDDYAIRVLTGKDDISDLTESERLDVLKNVSAAMSGHYERDGTPILFRPFFEDLNLVNKSFGRPELDDPALLARIELIRHNSTRIPDGKDALNILTNDEEKALIIKNKALLIETLGQEKYDRVIKEETEANKDSYKNAPEHIKRELLNVIVSEMRPELYDDPSYSKVVQNYYEKIEGHYTEHRAGKPDLDNEGRLVLNADGSTNWTGGMNGRYGGIHADELTKYYVHLNRFELEDMYGEEGASVFFNGHYSDRNRNDEVTYEEVMTHLKGVGDGSLAEKFHNSVREFDLATLHGFYELRPSQYDRATFANQQRNHMLELAQETVLTEEQNNTDENNQSDVNPANLNTGLEPADLSDPFPKIPGGYITWKVPGLIGSAYDAAKRLPGMHGNANNLAPRMPYPETPSPTAIHGTNPHYSPISTDYITKPTGTSIALIPNTDIVPRQSTDLTRIANEAISGEYIPAPRNQMTVTNTSNGPHVDTWINGEFTDITDSRINGSKTNPAAIDAAPTNYVMALPDTPPATATPSQPWLNSLINIGTPAAPASNATVLGLPSPETVSTANVTPNGSGETLRLEHKPSAASLPQKSPQDQWLDDLIAKENKSKLISNTIPEVKAPGWLSRFFSGAADAGRVTLRLGSQAGKYAAGAGVVVAAGLSTAEAAYLTNNQQALLDSGLIQADVQKELTAIYAAHVLQSTADPTIFGGEFGTQYLMEKLKADTGMDPIVAEMVMPDLLIELVTEKTNEAKRSEYERMKSLWEDENQIEDMYTGIINKYGLAEKLPFIAEDGTIEGVIDGQKQRVPFGTAMRDSNYADNFLSMISMGRKSTYDPVLRVTRYETQYHPELKAAYDSIMQINAMAGAARHEIANADLDLTIVGKDGQRYSIDYSKDEHFFGNAYDEDGFSWYMLGKGGGKTNPNYFDANGKYAQSYKDSVIQTRTEGFVSALIDNKDEVLDHMTFLITTRLERTDGEAHNAITSDDLEKVRDAIVKGGKLEGLQDAYAIEAFYAVVDTLPIDENEKHAVLRQKGKDTQVAATFIAETQQLYAKNGSELGEEFTRQTTEKLEREQTAYNTMRENLDNNIGLNTEAPKTPDIA